MKLIEILRDIAVREGFAEGRSLNEISEETELSAREVLRREVDLHLIPANEAATILAALELGRVQEDR
jgi:hypothetical protein